MAVDKLVDSTQLNADLTSVANAIRTKGGTSASLAFPSEFVSAIEAIETGGGGGGEGLPSEYQEVEYINTNNSHAYIDTGVVPFNGISINLKVGFNGSGTMPVFSAGQNDPQLVFLKDAGASNGYFKYCSSGSAVPIVLSTNYTTMYDCTADKNAIWLGASHSASPSFAGVPDTNLLLGKRANNASYFNGRYGRVTISDEYGVNIRQFVPCYRRVDSVAGMYDLVTSTFFTNVGDGAFTVGSDVVSDSTALSILMGETT